MQARLYVHIVGPKKLYGKSVKRIETGASGNTVFSKINQTMYSTESYRALQRLLRRPNPTTQVYCINMYIDLLSLRVHINFTVVNY